MRLSIGGHRNRPSKSQDSRHDPTLALRPAGHGPAHPRLDSEHSTGAPAAAPVRARWQRVEAHLLSFPSQSGTFPESCFQETNLPNLVQK